METNRPNPLTFADLSDTLIDDEAGFTSTRTTEHFEAPNWIKTGLFQFCCQKRKSAMQTKTIVLYYLRKHAADVLLCKQTKVIFVKPCMKTSLCTLLVCAVFLLLCFISSRLEPCSSGHIHFLLDLLLLEPAVVKGQAHHFWAKVNGHKWNLTSIIFCFDLFALFTHPLLLKPLRLLTSQPTSSAALSSAAD